MDKSLLIHVQRFVAELKVTHANIIGHNTVHHCSLEIQL